MLNNDLILILGMALVIFFGGIVQGAVGFAYAVVATPLFVWMGIPLQKTIVIIAACSFVQSSFAVGKLYPHVPWREVGYAIGLRTPFMIIGIFVLKKLTLFSSEEVNLVVGLIIITIVCIQIAFQVKPREVLHPAWAFLAFSSSGILAGISGMGGPPLVLWTMAHTWSSDKTRAFMFAAIMLAVPLQVFVQYETFGFEILESVQLGLLFTPVVILGSRIGMPIGHRMPKPVLRNIVYALLLVIALSSIMPSVWHSISDRL